MNKGLYAEIKAIAKEKVYLTLSDYWCENILKISKNTGKSYSEVICKLFPKF